MIIVNFSTKEYKLGQQRLCKSLNGCKKLMLDSYEIISSPSHSISPYEFKVHAIEKAKAFDPVVVWADASLWRVGDISKIEEIILRDGFFGEEGGHYAGRWTNEFTRKYFNVTEEEMHQGPGGITLFSAGLLGLDFNNDIAIRFFNEWKASGEAGCFKGSWDDHRHEMSCASIIATRLGLKYQRGGKHLSYVGPGYSDPEKDTVFLLQGL
jgi:hypothetical protein